MREIKARRAVHLTFIDLDRWRFLSVTGRARIVEDVETKCRLWQNELEQWFDDGLLARG